MIPAVTAIASIVSEATSAAGALNGAGAATASAAPASAGGFEEMLAQVTSQAAETLRTAEATSIQGLEGKASVQRVVEAVVSAQETLQTALAVRDKMVAAYQEVSRMSI